MIGATSIVVQTTSKYVRVYFDLLDNYGGDMRGVKTVSVEADETFGSLKDRLFESFTNPEFCKLSHRYELRLHFKSFSRLHRISSRPHLQDTVLRVLETECER